jgi:hypothetical protein
MCGSSLSMSTSGQRSPVSSPGRSPHIIFDERANEVNKCYVGQAAPKTLLPLLGTPWQRKRGEDRQDTRSVEGKPLEAS